MDNYKLSKQIVFLLIWCNAIACSLILFVGIVEVVPARISWTAFSWIIAIMATSAITANRKVE